MNEANDGAAGRWLVLVFQFPKGRDSRRVRVWRRLQRIGAVAIKHSVYVLPRNEQSREDFAWLVQELEASGAECALLESRLLGGIDDRQVRELFDGAREADYGALAGEIDAAVAALPAGEMGDAGGAEPARQALARAQRRIAEIEEIDFFGADGHDRVEIAMRELQQRISGGDDEAGPAAGGDKPRKSELDGRVWVTRRGVRVDRIASAWLVRRFVDPVAQFKFVAGKGYEPESGREIRFDMFEAEYTHEGDLCTFEVLTREIRPHDAALGAIGEIVHDIDLKDGKFGRPETAGIASLLAGVVEDTDDDDERIARGGAIFDNLYRFFGAGKN